ncbi:MAG: DUF2950 domain-containing protein [Desulfuromonadales bacterium]|nr:DUF2950 domain-containing protein [Desulfuromonadales bacterium]
MFATSSFSAQVDMPGKQQVYSSPEEALQSLLSAVTAKDHQKLRYIFGPVSQDLEPGDPVEQAAEFSHFSSELQERTELVKDGDSKAILLIGDEKWPFPVPVVKRDASWLFDTEAGREEILTRRIGHNELLAIKVCKSYLDAQREYYTMPDQEGEQIPKYAQRLISSPGKRDGLYWPTASGDKQSPLGLMVAKAREEGYMQKRAEGEKGRRPFHGYYFRILKRQGSHAPGGKFDYVINNNMIAGHALVAFPARWGVSGVMTFMVNQRGRVYQKNLGPKTAEIARKMKEYNPDLTWKLVEQ